MNLGNPAALFEEFPRSDIFIGPKGVPSPAE
jgi:hypothetical protein